MSPKMILSALLALLALTTIACGSAGVSCTEMGCENGTNLSFVDTDGKPITAFSGTITLTDQKIEIECAPNNAPASPAYLCNQNQVFIRTTDAKELTIDLRTTADPRLGYTGDVKVTHEPQYPNGKHCPVACHQATKTIVMAPIQTD